jgi:hypothetical protein
MISDLVDLGVPAPEKVVRSLLVFAFLVLALRVSGKRELAQLNGDRARCSSTSTAAG